MSDQKRREQAPASETDDSIVDSISWFLGAVVRQRWVILGTTFLVAVGIIAVSFQIPNRYESEATVFAVQQRIPERYVTPTATTDLSQALEAMVQEVMSRPRLLGIVNELKLYERERERLSAEQLIRRMRRDADVEPIERRLGNGEVNAFRVSFAADSPEVAQAVTQRLTDLFIQHNLKTRADQSATTTIFLREQLELSKRQLDLQEQRLRDFKMSHLGELPDQQQGTLGALTGLQAQLADVMASRSRAQQQRLYLESLLNEYQRQAPVKTPVEITPLQIAKQQLAKLDSDRAAMLGVYTPQHPDILRKDQEIERQRGLVKSLIAAAAATPEPRAQVESNGEQDMTRAQLRSQLQANTLELDNLAEKERRLQDGISAYQKKLNQTPVREQQLSSLQRDYDLLRQHYGDLLKKEQESQLATDLEKRQEGQQFRLADPPNLPSVPSYPDRMKLSMFGILGGLAIGAALALIREARDSSFRSEEEIAKYDGFPPVVSIPVLLTPAEERGRSAIRAVEYFAAVVLIGILAAAETYVYRNG